MRQDYDDYDTGSGYGRTSTVSWLVMGAAALGFLGLGWYAFSSSDSGDDSAEVVTLDAYEDPYKHEPAEKGGMEFPHQDKTIYDALDGNTRDGDAEKLFPEPEEPVIPEIPEAPKASEETTKEGDAESYVAEVPATEKAEKAAEAKEEAAKEEVAKEPVVKEVAKEAAPKETPKPEKPVEPQKPETPKPVEVKKETPKPVTPAVPTATTKPVEVNTTPAPPKPPAAKPVATGGSYAVQLGAFKSDAEARQQWSKISGKHGAVLGGTKSVVVRADLPNGTFYRLRAVGFASETAAKSACASLAKAGQGCFFAGK